MIAMFKIILVAVDGSTNSKRAVDMAIELAKCHNARLLLLHVIAEQRLPDEIVEMIRAGEITDYKSEILTTSAELLLQNARRHIENSGYSDVQGEYVSGDPARKILEYAEAHGADLIVIGHRGIDSQADMLGSVARKLVNLTRFTVLIVG
jgi:nucleotide-binding universal stress UspA family protein